MERIKQILTNNVSYITAADLNDLLERKDNLNPQESFMLGVNVGRMVEHAVNSEYYCDSDKIWVLHSFIEGNMQEKPAVIKKDLKDTVREYIEELNKRCIIIEHDSIRHYVYGVIKDLRHILGDFENDTDARLNFKTRSAEKLYSDFKSIEGWSKAAKVKNALNQTEKETITENHRLTKYP